MPRRTPPPADLAVVDLGPPTVGQPRSMRVRWQALDTTTGRVRYERHRGNQHWHFPDGTRVPLRLSNALCALPVTMPPGVAIVRVGLTLSAAAWRALDPEGRQWFTRALGAPAWPEEGDSRAVFAPVERYGTVHLLAVSLVERAGHRLTSTILDEIPAPTR